MNHRLGASVVFPALLLAAACADTGAPPPPIGAAIQEQVRLLRTYSDMGADNQLATAMNAVRTSCPLRFGDALAGAAREIEATPGRSGRSPATPDTHDPQSFIAFYNRIAAEDPRIPPQTLLRQAIVGMTSALDHESDGSGYLNTKYMMGPFASVGLEMRNERGQVFITGAIPESPAARAGIGAQDRLVAIDDMQVAGMDLDEVVYRLRGEEGSQVTLTISRIGQTGDIKVPLVRATVQRGKPDLRMQGNVAVITLSSFSENASTDIADLIRRAQQAQAAAYIIDIRKNGGGLIVQIVETASVFIEGGRVMSTVPPADCGSSEPREDYNAQRGFKLKDAPLIVLIGKETARGAEAFAAALSERGRARLVGQKTLGSSVVHTVIPLGPGGAAMRLKSSELFTANGNPVSSGVTPTVEIPEADDALAKALQMLGRPS
jgi:carboxyl-terminal processing protease